MSILHHPSSGRRLSLTSPALVGRDAACRLRIDAPGVSRHHAVLHWKGGMWTVRDLGSRNGTLVQDRLIPPHTDQPLREGQFLRFGSSPEETWELAQDGPPQAFAVREEGGEEELAESGFLLLPHREEAVLSVYRDAQGVWVAEGEGGATPVASGDVLEAGGRWKVYLPEAQATTVGEGPAWSLGESRLFFRVSRDQEHVTLTLRRGEEMLDLGDRQPWCVLHLLALERQKDEEGAGHDAGWVDVDRLARASGLQRRTLDVYLSRARLLLAEAGVEGAAQVVEVRFGQRRLGVPPSRVEVQEG